MITQIKDVLHSTNIIEAKDYPISIYSEHVDMMNIKWQINWLMMDATMKRIEHEIDHEGEAPLEQVR